VQRLLDEKGHNVWSVHPDDSVFDAIQMMANKDVGALLVMENDKPVGIVSQWDYSRKVILKGKSSPKTPVRDIMTTRIICARPEQTVEECMAVMTETHVRHLPVLREERLVGIVSMGDLVKSIITDQKFTIEQLVHYIHG
ncbi:MAG: CBS domain-containing protein, partial [Alphaproteobacteria bacterium]